MRSETHYKQKSAFHGSAPRLLAWLLWFNFIFIDLSLFRTVECNISFYEYFTTYLFILFPNLSFSFFGVFPIGKLERWFCLLTVYVGMFSQAPGESNVGREAKIKMWTCGSPRFVGELGKCFSVWSTRDSKRWKHLPIVHLLCPSGVKDTAERENSPRCFDFPEEFGA